jgi:hypothetical protein
MQTAEQVLDAVRQLPRDERMRFLAKVAALQLDPNEEGAGSISDSWQDLLALAGSVDRGKVHVPFPDRDMLYEAR